MVKDKCQRIGAEKRLELIKDRVCQQLSLLQEGKYLYRDQETKQWLDRGIDIEPHHRSRYVKIAEKKIDICVIIYDLLDEEINNFLKESNDRCIFDVSATLKGLLIDTYTILQAKGIKDIYVFELRLRERTYDEKELVIVHKGLYETV